MGERVKCQISLRVKYRQNQKPTLESTIIHVHYAWGNNIYNDIVYSSKNKRNEIKSLTKLFQLIINNQHNSNTTSCK